MKRGVVILACALVASCGASKKSAAPASMAAPRSPAEASSVAPIPGDPHAEIDQLSAAIEEERVQLGLEPQAAVPMTSGAARMSTIPLSTDESCKPAKTERCESSCKMSDSICKNASRICELANELAGDSWAAGKCASAKQTCETAHENCCTCQ
jgi:hypothetical protein